MSDNNTTNYNKIPCAVYNDLLPLVTEGLASDESRILVEEHQKTCPNCSLNQTNDIYQMNENNILKKIKLQIISLAFIPLIIGILFGVSLGISQAMFNNIWLMPLLGGVSAIIYRKKSLWLTLIVFITVSIFHALPIHYNESYQLVFILAGIQWGNIYAGLFLLGQVITGLFQFALKKEGDTIEE